MKKLLAYIGLFVAVTIWSISFVSIDVCLLYINAMEVNIFRFFIAAIFLWIVYLVRGVRMQFKRKDQLRIFLAGVFGTAGYYFFENVSLNYISPATVSIITGAIPIMTLIVAMLFLGKKTKFRNIFFIILSFVGIVILTNPAADRMTTDIKGILLVVMANLCWVIYTLVNEPLNHEYDKLNLLTIQVFYGAVVYGLIYFYQIGSGIAEPVNLTQVMMNTELVFQLVFLAIMSSCVAYFLYNYALQKVGVTLTALFINVIPVATLLLSVAIGHETFTFNKIIGCLLVVVAVYMIEDI